MYGASAHCLWWHYACDFAEHRGAFYDRDRPPAVCVAALLADRWHLGSRHALAGFVGAVNTDASMVLFEWLVTNPGHHGRLRYRAVAHLMRAGLIYATAIGKRPVIINGTRGIRQMAQRIGLASGTSFEVLMGEMS